MTIFYTYIHLNGQFVPAGVVKTEEEQRQGHSTFRYGRRYLERPDAVAIDPVTLPLSTVEFKTPKWLTLFGALRDASPDSWGRYVLEKTAGRALSETEVLLAASMDRIGALGFGLDPVKGPQTVGLPSHLDHVLDLDDLVVAAQQYMEKDQEIDIRLQPFVHYGTSFGGARPKALARYQGRSWLAKFEGRDDLRAETRIEFANMSLASICGLNVPRVDHVTVSSGHNVFLIERFDRNEEDGRTIRSHFVSGLTMLNESENYVVKMDPQKHSYAALADIIRRYGAQATIKQDQRELFARMVFNIICQNGDDHLRNHGFTFDPEAGGWRLAPCYDVVPDAKPYSRLGLFVGPDGRNATFENALAGCQAFGLQKDEATGIIHRMVEAAADWRLHFSRCGVPEADLRQLEKNFRLHGLQVKQMGLDADLEAFNGPGM